MLLRVIKDYVHFGELLFSLKYSNDKSRFQVQSLQKKIPVIWEEYLTLRFWLLIRFQAQRRSINSVASSSNVLMLNHNQVGRNNSPSRNGWEEKEGKDRYCCIFWTIHSSFPYCKRFLVCLIDHTSAWGARDISLPPPSPPPLRAKRLNTAKSILDWTIRIWDTHKPERVYLAPTISDRHQFSNDRPKALFPSHKFWTLSIHVLNLAQALIPPEEGTGQRIDAFQPFYPQHGSHLSRTRFYLLHISSARSTCTQFSLDLPLSRLFSTLNSWIALITSSSPRLNSG